MAISYAWNAYRWSIIKMAIYDQPPLSISYAPCFEVLFIVYLKPVMWIRIDCMRIRIHKIWWMRIRIQVELNHQINIQIPTII